MYSLLDIKWGPSTYGTAGGTVTWSEDLEDLPRAEGMTNEHVENALRMAFQAWEGVAAIDFRQVDSGADITIGASSFSTTGVVTDDLVVGVASWDSSGFGLSQPSNVQIQFNSDYSWSPFSVPGLDAVDFHAVALHEIGHVIGLGHVNDPSEIMNTYVAVETLGDGDKAGAQAIYGLDEGDEPVEGEEQTSGPVLQGGEDGGGGGGIGLLAGLLALVFGFLTGGVGMASVVAAGRVATTRDHDHDHDHHHDHDHDHHHDHDGGFHVLRLPQIPVEAFEHTRSLDEHEGEEIYLL